MTTKIATQIAEAPQKGLQWKFEFIGALSKPGASRVFTAAAFHAFAQTIKPGVSEGTTRALSELLISAGMLQRVSNGIFLNKRKFPPAELVEAAAYLRHGAVISLHSVLGEMGFLNNPSRAVVAVLPTSASKRPKLGEHRTSAGDTFMYYGLAEKFFPQPGEDDFELLQPGRPCATFRPEAALLQWLHLARMQRSTLALPPVDVDMSLLNEDLLERLSRKWGLEPALHAWLEKAKAANFGEEPDLFAPSAPQEDKGKAAAEAKQRLLARRRMV